MLIQFSFKNYKSFKEEVALDLIPTKATEFSDRIVSTGGIKVLPMAAIYGANASGKSNIYSAFLYMSDYVINSFKYDENNENYKNIAPTPFLFDSNSANSESSFEVFFTILHDNEEKVYNYGFSVGVNGIREEWLYSKAKTARKFKPIFFRKQNGELNLSGLPKKSRDNIQVALEKQVLIASLGAKLKISKCQIVRDWFLSNLFADFGNPITNYFLSTILPNDFVENKSVQDKIVDYFASFDKHILGFNIEKVPEDEANKEEIYKVSSLHQMIDSNEMVEIPFSSESAGTLKMFSLYPSLQKVLEEGSVFFIDELNARLHPLLVRNFLLLFLNPEVNKNHAQLIFTTHDSWLLSPPLLRRDEVWFVEKNDKGISSLYSLADFVDKEGSRIRKDENYEKNYLLGKYGAIPSLKNFDIFNGK